jgi:hypothetical protein
MHNNALMQVSTLPKATINFQEVLLEITQPESHSRRDESPTHQRAALRY